MWPCTVTWQQSNRSALALWSHLATQHYEKFGELVININILEMIMIMLTRVWSFTSVNVDMRPSSYLIDLGPLWLSHHRIIIIIDGISFKRNCRWKCFLDPTQSSSLTRYFLYSAKLKARDSCESLSFKSRVTHKCRYIGRKALKEKEGWGAFFRPRTNKYL